jgi:hypothetical protein
MVLPPAAPTPPYYNVNTLLGLTLDQLVELYALLYGPTAFSTQSIDLDWSSTPVEYIFSSTQIVPPFTIGTLIPLNQIVFTSPGANGTYGYVTSCSKTSVYVRTSTPYTVTFTNPFAVPIYTRGQVVRFNESGEDKTNSFTAVVIDCTTADVTIMNLINTTVSVTPIANWIIGSEVTTTPDSISLTVNQISTVNFQITHPTTPYAIGDLIKFVSGPGPDYSFTANVIQCSTTSVQVNILTISGTGLGIHPWTIYALHPKTKYKDRCKTWFYAKLSGQSLTATQIESEFAFPGLFQMFTDYYGLTAQLSQLNENLKPPEVNPRPEIRMSDFYGVTNDYFPYEVDPVANSTSTKQTPSQFISGPSSSFTLLQSGWIYGNNVPTIQQSAYVNAVAAALIDSVELKIGGQLIETLTGEYIQNTMDMQTPLENKPALTILYGKDDTSAIYSPRTYLLNLPFYFYRETGLAIPLVALSRQDVEILFKFNYIGAGLDIGRAINIQPFVYVPPQNIKVTLIAEYAYLTGPELDYFKNKKLEYLVSQVQLSRQILPVNSVGGFFQLNFVNPVVELQFFIRNNRNINIDPSNIYTQNLVTDYFDYNNNGVKNMALFFNGQEAFTSTTADAIYLGALEILDKHTAPAFSKGTPTSNVFMYAFSMKPEHVSNPSGHVNMSRIRQQVLEINMRPDPVYEKQLSIYAVNYNILRVQYGLGGLLFNSSQ